VAALVRSPFVLVAAVADSLLARRGLALLFLLAAAGLALASGLRPPLSQDISSLHLPIGFAGSAALPEELLSGSHPVELTSAAVILLISIGMLALAVLWRPGLITVAAGLLITCSVAVNAALILNHPALIELMDMEYDQSQQIAGVFAHAPYKSTLTTSNTGRLQDARPAEDEQRGDLLRGWTYLLYGQWLPVLGAVGVLFGSRCSIGRRLVCVAVWSLVGIGLAGMVCAPRLQAEYQWNRAKLLEAAGYFKASRQALDNATTLLPEFGRLERTWLLDGKLDHRLARRTPSEQAFRAYQLGRNKRQPRTSPRCEDLPWRTALSADDKDWRRALGLLGDLTPAQEQGVAWRHQAAQLWTDIGLFYYDAMPQATDAGLNYFPQKRRLGTAASAWQEAARLEPTRRDCAFSTGLVLASADPGHSLRYITAFGQAMNQLADRLIRADILNALGDGYFRAGELLKARTSYAESSDAFSVPTRPNRRSQKGIGGGQ
jgi:hypothetical protein